MGIISINRVTLLGQVSKEPVISTTNDGKPMAHFSLATSTGGYKTKDGEEVPEVKEWHTLSAYGYWGSKVSEFVHKGDILYIEGTLHSYRIGEIPITETVITSFKVILADYSKRLYYENKRRYRQRAKKFNQPVSQIDDVSSWDSQEENNRNNNTENKEAKPTE